MITRSQIRRQLRSQGGIMNVVGRQKYGLGSFVKKAFGKAKDVVSSVVKSPIGKAALLGTAAYFGGPAIMKGLGSIGPKFATGKNFLTSGCFIYPMNITCVEKVSWYNKSRTLQAAIEGEGWAKDWGNRKNDCFALSSR